VLQRAIGGDVDALEQLFDEHEDRLLAYVVRHLPLDLRSSTDPDDILQDTYYRACQAIRGFIPEGEECVYRWLVTIARKRMVELLRLYRSRYRVDPRGVQDSDDAEVISLLAQLVVYRRTPSQSAASHELLAAVEQSVHRLPPVYREVVTCRYLEGLTVVDTAARMRRTGDAIHWLCYRALRALRTELRSASLFI
jgi:RNA polymerase sigma-70 factor, ECF subfamily